MTHFIIIYDPKKSVSTVVEEIEGADEARDRLEALEEEVRDDPSREVVLLIADSRSDLSATHARYFTSLDELLELA